MEIFKKKIKVIYKLFVDFHCDAFIKDDEFFEESGDELIVHYNNF